MKTQTHIFIVFICLVAALGFLPRKARAANACPGATVTSSGVAFGPYDAVAGTAVTSSGTITITCGGHGTGPILTIKLNAGLNSGSSFNPRVMKSTTSADTLNYNLYVDTTYAATSIWGDGTAGTTFLSNVNTVPSGGSDTAVVTVYGQIPGSQDPSGACPATPCTYNDTITVTITF